MNPSAAALALAGLDQVKHPNFGGFSQGIENCPCADNGYLIHKADAHKCSGALIRFRVQLSAT